MPIYEYECKNCSHQFELIQKFNDAPQTLCPECQQHTVVKLVSAAGFQLKGTGWYVTDFKNNDKPKKEANKSANDVPKNKIEKDTAKQKTGTTGSDKQKTS